jgi:hypothetical protein
VPMSEGPGVWPWWLWTLCALWIGTSLVWRPAASARGERAAWMTLAVIYAGLIVFVARMTPPEMDAASSHVWRLWIALILFLGSAVVAVPVQSPRGQSIAWGLTALSASTVLLLLHAPEAAVIAIGFGVLLLRTVGLTAPDPEGAVVAQNQWLVGTVAVVTLVMAIGLTRHALIVESTRAGLSHTRTVFPSRTQITRQRTESSAVTMMNWEIGGLALMAVVAFATGAASDRALRSRSTP